MDSIVLFGDSLTELGWQPNGYVQRLAEVYAGKLDVINRGFSGYNTTWAIPIFEQCFAVRGPAVRLLIIWLGGNDSTLVPSPQHVPLPTYTANLHHLVRSIKNPASPCYSPSTALILLTPPPVDTVKRGASLASRDPPIKLDRNFDVTKAYAEAAMAVGLENGVPVVDVWNIIFDAAGRNEQMLGKFLCDGLHLSAVGYEMVFEALVNKIKESYPQLHHENLQSVFPHWKEINWDDPIPSIKKREPVVPN